MPDPFSREALAGRVAIVTGAASGIGLATARALARAGAAVALADLDGDGAERAAATLADGGAKAIGVACDVGDEEAVAALIERTARELGGLDVLHNNAADSDPALMARDGAVADMTAEVWDRTLRVNLRGPMFGCKHAIPHMIQRGGGVIVNTSSASGLTGDDARSAYAASKAGLVSLTRSVATQYGKQGIRCNAIAPGVIATPALEANVPDVQVRIYREQTLLPRLGSAEDIAGAVVFLASDAGAFVTGQILSVDGGMLAHHPAVADGRRLAGEGSKAGSGGETS